MYRSQSAYNNTSSLTSLGITVIIASVISGSTGNVGAVDYISEHLEAAPSAQSYKIKNKMSSSNSSWNQVQIMQSSTPIMDAFKSEMEDFWHQIESGEFEFSSDEMAMAGEILNSHPNVLL